MKRLTTAAMKPLWLALSAALALGLAACAEQIDAGGSDVDAGVEDDPLTSIDDPVEAGSLDDLFQGIMAARCSGEPGLCHNGQFEPNLSTPANVYAYMVNRPAIEDRAKLRVAPGDPDNSFLIDKLRGRDVGTIMPLGADPLTEEEIQLFEAWIRSGALREPGADPAPVLNNPPTVPEIAIFDDQGTRLDLGPFSVSVGMNLVMRHTVADFETPDDQIPFATFILAAATGENVVLRPGAPDDPQLGVTTFDPGGPMGLGDVLNYRFEFTIPAMLELRNDAGQVRTVPAAGMTLTPLVAYLDSFPDGIATLAVSPNTITVE